MILRVSRLGNAQISQPAAVDCPPAGRPLSSSCVLTRGSAGSRPHSLTEESHVSHHREVGRVRACGHGGRFENLGGGKAFGALVNATEVMTVDLAGVAVKPAGGFSVVVFKQ
jgi:hypothetical protein